MAIYAISNQKGGVGKSTTAAALAEGLYRRGRSVLVIDLDPQSNLSYGLGVDLVAMERTLFDVLKGVCETEKALQTIKLGYDLLTVGLGASMADLTFTMTGREYLLKKALKDIRANYDDIVIDTPPTVGTLLSMALTVTDAVIIPVTSDLYALQALKQLGAFIDNIREYTNEDLKIAGLLVTRYSQRLALSKALSDAIQAAANDMQTKVFETKIRENVAARESQLARESLFDYAARSAVAKDYEQWFNELLGEQEG